VPTTEIPLSNDTVLLTWEANDRPTKVWSKEFYSSVIVIAFLVSVILYFIEGIMPVLVVCALVFMMWSMNKTEPKKVKYELLPQGLKTVDKLYTFDEMDFFWVENKWGHVVLRINLIEAPWHIVIVVDPGLESELKNLMSQAVPYQVPVPTWSDKAVKWLGEKMPLE